MKLFILTIYCILLVSIGYLRAQSYSSVHYDTKDGLPSSTVYDITQDKNGFIWFATENGLCRFDGKNFKTFTTKDGLPDNSILKVHGDNTGRVYFNAFTHGVHYYQNDSFFKVVVPDKYKVDLSNISLFANQGEKLVLFGIFDSYILENDRIVSFHDKYNVVATEVGIGRVYDTLIIVGSGDSLYYIPESGKIRVRLYNHKATTYNLLDENGLIKELNIPKKSPATLRQYLADSIVYIFFDDVVNFFSSSTGAMLYKIKVDKFSKAFIDSEKNLWISTVGNGVYRIPSLGFRNINFDGKSEIFSLLKNGDQLMAGTDFSKVYNIPLQNVQSPYSVTDLSKYTILSKNPISLTTKRNRIYVLHKQANSLYTGTDAFLLKKSGSSSPFFRAIHPVKDIDVMAKKVLVCTGYNTLLLDEGNMSIKDTLLRQRSTCGVIYHNDYYIGTIGGLIKINSTDKKIIELYSLFPLFRNRITAIKRGIHDDLWVATSGSGLVRFKNGRIIRTLKEEDGLTSDICTSLFIDSNLIWLGTNNGLNRIEPGKEKVTITRFTSANGLGADFINTVFATDSNVCVGTAAGLTIFNKNILTEKSVCILHILEVSENNKRLKKDSSYSFSYNALNIQIDFTAISFKSAGDITYYYQLKGLDKSWNTTGSNFVNFPTLQPDKYTFFLKAVNKFGVESDTKSISIIIQPPWWQTWLFRITVVATVAVLVLLIYRYSIKNIRRKEEMKREFEARFSALEQQALQAQINPHFIFNSLNSIQTFILNLDVEGANAYLTNFASLIRQTLENSMHPLITIATELKYLETYLSLEKLRFRDKFRHTINIDDTIDQYNTLLPGMLLQPYIENSIRHGIQHRKDNNGFISLNITKTTDNAVLYVIKDNGVGRKKAAELKSSRHIEYQSRGTYINEKRIAAINNQFKINIRVNTEDILNEDGVVVGTSVTLVIPTLHKQ